MTVLCPPGMEGQAFKHRYDVKSLEDISGIDNVATLKGWQTPVKVDLNRVKILYDEDGGTAKDGMIEIRAKLDSQGNPIPACDDLSLGNARYGQVRIAVDCGKDCTRYIKGMAVYNPDLPEGMDIRVNSNKSRDDGVKKSLKDYDEGSANPFGATVVQTYIKDSQGNPVIDSKTGKAKLSAIQFVGTPTDDDHDLHAEGSWGDWSRNLPAQFLAKQNLPLVKQQLKLKTLETETEYKDILSMTNTTVKKKLLLDFADQCDAAAVDLKAAPLPGQGVHVLLQSNTLKDTEIYAPNYPNGTTVALVRFPHTGPFEIPVCTVNNNDKESRKQIGKNAKDAVKIIFDSANDSHLSIVAPFLLLSCMQKKQDFFAWLGKQKNINERVENFIIHQIDPTAIYVKESQSCSWRALLEADNGEKCIDFYLSLYLLAHNWKDRQSVEMLKHSFYHIYQDLSKSKLSSKDWDRISRVTPNRYFIAKWDKCKILSRGLVDYLKDCDVDIDEVRVFSPNKKVNNNLVHYWNKN